MEVASIIGKFLIFWKILSIATASDNGGFIFTAPRRFLSGYNENVCITFKEQKGPVEVKVAVLEQKEDNEIASAVEEVAMEDGGSKCFKIFMPRTKIQKGRLQLTINLKTEEDFKINYVEQISIQTNPDITFIQTDKPVYNGGDIVRFRIFTVRSDLTPVFHPVDRIWIENPNGIQLAQWLNEPVREGFINKTFQLSSEPMLGKWFIRMKRKDDEIVSQSFLIENYILPKFSVAIKTSEFMNFNSNNVSICAKYVFGEPVQGNVILQYFIKCSFSYYCQENESSVTQRSRLRSDGCIDFEITLKSVSSFAQSLIINATVIEDGSRIKAKASSKVEFRNEKEKRLPEFSSSTRTRKLKPGLPFRGQVVLKGEPELDEMIILCLEANDRRICREVVMSTNVTDFLILPISIRDEKTFKASLEVKNPREVATQGSNIIKLNLVPWYSPSGSYLQLENLYDGPLKCHQKAVFNVLYSNPSSSSRIKFHYMVKARGDILAKGILDQFSAYAKPFEIPQYIYIINHEDVNEVKEFTFSINISTKMSPQSYLLVYFIRDDGEVVADTLQLPVEKCLPNKVLTKWQESVSLPGSENEFSIETSSTSICALTVTDKSTKLVTNSVDFNEDHVYKSVEKYEIKSQSPEYNTNRCSDDTTAIPAATDEMEALLELPEMDSRFIDSRQAFNDFGALVITDLHLETRPCKEKGIGGRMLINATTRNSNINIYGTEVENISIFKIEDGLVNAAQPPNHRETAVAYELRTFFPETWIWDLVSTNSSSPVNLKLAVPHTITEWTAETICLSAKEGLGVSQSSKFITYQPFFMDFAVPHSLKKKEIFHLQVSVFNYELDDLPVKITFVPSRSFLSMSEEFQSYCIPSKSKVVHRFVIRPVKLGEAKVMVKAEIDSKFAENCGNVISDKSDIVVKKTIVKHEGFPMEEVKSGFICSENSRFDHEVTWNMKIPADVVESSISLKALVSGDILGPSLKNVNHLISLPTGCGEQNMILLVPNILILDYLLLTKSEEVEMIEKALKNLDLGYQRQLNYKHGDGSYSAFGEQDEKGSIWLTAFVVRYLSLAKKYIYVDTKDLNASVAWIMKHQLENGCFPMIGKVYHRKLQEKLMEEESSKTLTAYILISLLEAGISLDNPVVKNAIYCLKPTDESLGTYGDLLSSYALILAGDYRDSQALMMELLKEAQRSYGMLWWENQDSIESTIEMTSYGILSLVKLGGPLFLAAASDAVRWIIQYQNQNGGFVSSQDTVLALEAISKLSTILPRMSDHDNLFVEIQTTEHKQTFNISNENRLIQQEADLPPYVTKIHIESSGKGCALVQTWLKYNTQRGKPNKNLKIQLRIDSVSDVDLYSVAKFRACVRYKVPKDSITMAVLEVFMVSGYFPDRSSLYEIRTSPKGVRRWEEFEDRVNFYFEDLKNKKVCVNFLVLREVCIQNPAPALVKLYDYYNTQHETTVKYNLMTECQNNSSWLSNASSELKKESKRDLKHAENIFTSYNKGSNYNGGGNFEGFVDFSQELETPKGGGNVFPVFALPPRKNSSEPNCVHCLSTVPNLFGKMYCSSDIAVKVLILNKETFQIQLDVSPRRNFTSVQHTVSFTMKEGCKCPFLNAVNSHALLLVTPPRSFRVHYLHEIHLDDSIQLYPWESGDDLPNYLKDAIKYCQSWRNDY